MPRAPERPSLDEEVEGILQLLQGLQARIQTQHGDFARAEELVAQAQSKATAAATAATESTQAAKAALAALRKAHAS